MIWLTEIEIEIKIIIGTFFGGASNEDGIFIYAHNIIIWHPRVFRPSYNPGKTETINWKRKK